MRRLLVLFALSVKDAWNQRLSLLILTSCCMLGTAALVSISGLRNSLEGAIEVNKKVLLGADFLISSRRKPAPEVINLVSNLETDLSTPLEMAEEINLASMLVANKSSMSRLIQLSAVDPNYPFYGKIVPTDNELSNTIDSGEILLDKSLMTQLEISAGDQVTVGKKVFTVKGSILQMPGSIDLRSTIAPRALMPRGDLAETGLLTLGSLARYNFYFKTAKPISTEFLREKLDSRMALNHLRLETSDDRGESLKKTLDTVFRFLDVVSILSLILGGLGISAGVYTYSRKKKNFLNTLYHIGCSRSETFFILTFQLFMFGILGTIPGLGIGLVSQYFVPTIFAGVLPAEFSFEISWRNTGISFSTSVILLLISIITPLFYDGFLSRIKLKGSRELILSMLSLVVALFLALVFWSSLITHSIKLSFIYILGIFSVISALSLAGYFLSRLGKRLANGSRSVALQQGYRNLYRPNNRTQMLILAIGVSAFVLFFVECLSAVSIGKLTKLSDDGSANILLFDVQEDQLEGLREHLSTQGVEVREVAPIVTMRLQRIKGRTIQDIRSDKVEPKSEKTPDWTLTREYRSSFLNEGTASDVNIIKGDFIRDWDSAEPIPVSLEKGIAEKLELDLNDPIEFNVQGRMLETYVSSIRKVDWQQLKPNFFVLFPAGVLEDAPKTYVLTGHAPSEEISAASQRSLTKAYGNVSVIDLELILSTVKQISSQLREIIYFLGIFVIGTSVLLLLALLWSSQSIRAEENLLLRTLGASRKTIFSITLVEYASISVIGSLSGLLLAILGVTIYGYWVLDMSPILPTMRLVLMVLIFVTSTMVISLMSSIGVLQRSGNESFRRLES